MVQNFQRGSRFFSKISPNFSVNKSRGIHVHQKLVMRGTNFGGSIFTMTGPFIVFTSWGVTTTIIWTVYDVGNQQL